MIEMTLLVIATKNSFTQNKNLQYIIMGRKNVTIELYLRSYLYGYTLDEIRTVWSLARKVLHSNVSATWTVQAGPSTVSLTEICYCHIPVRNCKKKNTRF